MARYDDEYEDDDYDDDNSPLSPFEKSLGRQWTDEDDARLAAGDDSFVSQPAINLYESGGMEWPGSRSTVQGTPAPTSGPAAAPMSLSSGDGGGGESLGFEPAGFEWPEFVAPQFRYDPFQSPSLEDAMAEPGYEFARKEGIRALENSASGRGVLRTGGTLKDLIGWGNQFAEQNFSNVYNRKADAYTRNYGVARDVFDREYRGKFDEFQPKFRAAEATFDDLYRRWRDELGATSGLASMGTL